MEPIPTPQQRRARIASLRHEYRGLFLSKLRHTVVVKCVPYLWAYYLLVVVFAPSSPGFWYALLVYGIVPWGSVLVYYLRQRARLMPQRFRLYSADGYLVREKALMNRIEYMRNLRTAFHEMYVEETPAVEQALETMAKADATVATDPPPASLP